ncbi:MAG TPA: proline iminopeptidase-family hydrolase [Nitrososphaerales archaeon]|nr:proline iminopeptidase-family hydrolase [Nitrososphaerales archaeon]
MTSEVYTVVKLDGYSEGYVKAQGHWIFFKSFGEPKKGTILCLHGGPGGTHDSGVPMARLTSDGFRVVFYDQLGCGKSDQPHNQVLYTVERYVEEVDGVRSGLDLGKVHLYGHSWGGFLGVAYATKYSSNLESLLVSSGSSSTPLCVEEMWRLRSELPGSLRDTLNKYEAEGDYLNDEYLRALDEVYKRHLCRLDPWPPMIHSMVEDKRRGGPGLVYKLMWGPNEFFAVGTLRYWDVTGLLNRITVPTLITNGRYDEVTPRNGEVLHQGIKDSKFVIFEKSSHTARLEEPEKYFEVYGGFLRALL